MSKRPIDSKNSESKKPKFDDFDDSWGDDFDGDLIDDCFQKATQAFAETNVSLLTSYSHFKQPQSLITSTQCGQTSFATYSKNDPSDLQKRIKDLEQKCVEKEGEVSILRINIENLKKEFHNDQQKKETEWKEKLSSMEKQAQAAKNELQFKHLEVANLKQQLADFAKLPNAEESFIQKFQFSQIRCTNVASPEKTSANSVNVCHKVYINAKKYCSFKVRHFSFNIEESKNLKKDLSRDAALTSLVEKRNCIAQTLISLNGQSIENLDSKENVLLIQKIVLCTFEIFDIFSQALKNSKETDAKHQHNRVEVISLISQEVVELLLDILPLSTTLKNCFFSGNLEDEMSKNCDKILNILSEILSLITRNKHLDCQKFGLALVKFFTFIFSAKDVRENIIQSVLTNFSRFKNSDELLYETSVFLHVATRNPDMVTCLCSNQSNERNETCKFLDFVELVNNTVTKDKNGKKFLRFNTSILGLVYNVFRANNEWTQQENIHCDCLRKLSALVVAFIYRTTNEPSFGQNPKKLKTVMKVLNLTSNLAQKYVTDFANFKEIVYKILHLGVEVDAINLQKLENLSLTEDFVQIPKEKFLKVNL